jgi:uncharacterized protein YigA (DUF484 family)
MKAEPPDSDPEADRLVSAHLRANPGFLAARPELFAVLAPPARVHGPVLADHMAAMLRAARSHAGDMHARAEAVLAAGRCAASVAERVQAAILAALQACDLAECVAETWPGLLRVDAAALCCEGRAARWRSLPVGKVATLLGRHAMVFRDRPEDAATVHAEAAPLATRDLLVRVPGGRPALLALASRDPASLPQVQGWAFLGAVLGVLSRGGLSQDDTTKMGRKRRTQADRPRLLPAPVASA